MYKHNFQTPLKTKEDLELFDSMLTDTVATYAGKYKICLKL